MAPKTNMRNHDFHDAFHVRSEKLVELRAVIREWKDLNNIVGGAFQFRLVVDTNVILGDLIWLVSKRTDDTAKTSLMEAAETGEATPARPNHNTNLRRVCIMADAYSASGEPALLTQAEIKAISGEEFA